MSLLFFYGLRVLKQLRPLGEDAPQLEYSLYRRNSIFYGLKREREVLKSLEMGCSEDVFV